MNLTELHKKFGTQDKCIAYLQKLIKDAIKSCINVKRFRESMQKEKEDMVKLQEMIDGKS